MKYYFLTAIIILTAGAATAQVLTDSSEYTPLNRTANNLITKLDKLLSTYLFSSEFNLNKKLGSFSLQVDEDYHSSFISSGEKSIRDEQSLGISGSYKVSSILDIGAYASNKILSDNRKIEINQASISNAVLFTQLFPEENIFLFPYGGYTNNRQIGENDYGFLYGIDGSLSSYTVSDLILNTDIKFRNEDISPRKNALRFINLLLTNNFSGDVKNILNLNYGLNRKDFYYEADAATSQAFNIINNIQSRIESNYILQDRLLYNNFLNLFNLDITGKVHWRVIDRDTRYRLTDINSTSIFDTKINELRFEFESISTYSSGIFDGALRIIYSERDEKHIAKNITGANPIFYEQRSDLESQKNNNSSRASVSLTGRLNITRKDLLHFSLFQNKLRYDTPGKDNFDDRDETLSIFRMRYSRKLTPFFEAFINTEGTINHIVYLFSEKSSNNNINRVLRLSAGGDYNGKNFRSLNNFEVSANYTVYDFEDINPNYKSFSFRQFTAIDSSVFKLTGTVSFSAYGYIKLSEQGDLKWGEFSTKPNRYLEELYAEPKLILSFSSISISAGIRIFSLKTFRYNELNKIPDSDYLSRGPVTELAYLTDNVQIRFFTWFEFISAQNAPERDQINFTLQMNWDF